MARRSRIRILGAAALVTLVCGPPGCGAIYKYVGGDFAGPPGQLELSISPAAKELMRRAFRGFEHGGCIDAHVHAGAQPFDRARLPGHRRQSVGSGKAESIIDAGTPASPSAFPAVRLPRA